MSRARLDIYIGPMFSGKTSKLVDIYEECIAKQTNVVAINYIDDTRYHASLLSTHDKRMIPCVQCKQLNEIAYLPQILNNDVILINEGQFFNDIYETVLSLVETYNKHVVICGLDGDFKRTKFGKLFELIPYCDSVIKLCAICTCGQPAIFSHRTSAEEQQVVIGADNYLPMCRACYKNATSNKSSGVDAKTASNEIYLS